MPQMNFDLEDGQDPVSFSLSPGDAERFQAFMAECNGHFKRAERLEKVLEQERAAANHYKAMNQPLKETQKLAQAFANAKGRHNSQVAMCRLLEHFGKPAVWPTTDG